MKSKPKKRRYCAYSECYLPDNNNIYLLQMVYAIISAVILGANGKNFSLMNILLYIAPFLIDLTQNKFDVLVYKILRFILIILNVALLIFSVCGMFIMEESENCFTIIETSMILSGYVFQKQHVLYCCMIDILVPCLLYKAVPCRKIIEAFNTVENHFNKRKQNNIENKEVAV